MYSGPQAASADVTRTFASCVSVQLCHAYRRVLAVAVAAEVADHVAEFEHRLVATLGREVLLVRCA